MATTRKTKPAPAPQTDEVREQAAQIGFDDSLLEGIPSLKPPAALWGTQRAKPKALAARAADMSDAHGEISAEDALLLGGEIVDFFYTLALDKQAYIKWATALSGTDEYMIPFALVSHYVRAEGE